MTFVCLNKAASSGCLIRPQDSQATANTSQGLLLATEVKHMAQTMLWDMCLPPQSGSNMILTVMVPAAFLGTGKENLSLQAHWGRDKCWTARDDQSAEALCNMKSHLAVRPEVAA